MRYVFDDWVKFDPNFRSIAEFLGVEDYLYYQDRLLTIKKWAERKAGSNDRVAVLSQIKTALDTVGHGELGKRPVENLYKWIRLDEEIHGIREEQKLYEKPLPENTEEVKNEQVIEKPQGEEHAGT